MQRQALDRSTGAHHADLPRSFLRRGSISRQVGSLEEIIRETAPFEFELRDAARFPTTLFLVPDPSAAFARLTEAIVRQFPGLSSIRRSVRHHRSASDGGARERPAAGRGRSGRSTHLADHVDSARGPASRRGRSRLGTLGGSGAAAIRRLSHRRAACMPSLTPTRGACEPRRHGGWCGALRARPR